jgi:hypothetical protein
VPEDELPTPVEVEVPETRRSQLQHRLLNASACGPGLLQPDTSRRVSRCTNWRNRRMQCGVHEWQARVRCDRSAQLKIASNRRLQQPGKASGPIKVIETKIDNLADRWWLHHQRLPTPVAKKPKPRDEKAQKPDMSLSEALLTVAVRWPIS